jgi:hypothetical protein
VRTVAPPEESIKHNDTQDKKIPPLVQRLHSIVKKEIEKVPRNYKERFAQKVRHQFYHSGQWGKIAGR